MSVIKRYGGFKTALRGYTEVEFTDFRNRVLPLRANRVWDEEMVEYASKLIDSGAGHALQALCGVRHPAAALVLGPTELKADPMTKLELDNHMCALIKNCRATGWSAETYIAFVAYLNSDAARAPADPAPGPPPAGPPAMCDEEPPAPPSGKDRFAEMYRAASPAFKRVVVEHLAIAAATA
jgi:hypothetical protein